MGGCPVIFARYLQREGNNLARAYVIQDDTGPTLQIEETKTGVTFAVTGRGGFAGVSWSWVEARKQLVGAGACPLFLSLGATLALPFVANPGDEKR